MLLPAADFVSRGLGGSASLSLMGARDLGVDQPSGSLAGLALRAGSGVAVGWHLRRPLCAVAGLLGHLRVGVIWRARPLGAMPGLGSELASLACRFAGRGASWGVGGFVRPLFRPSRILWRSLVPREIEVFQKYLARVSLLSPCSPFAAPLAAALLLWSKGLKVDIRIQRITGCIGLYTYSRIFWTPRPCWFIHPRSHRTWHWWTMPLPVLTPEQKEAAVEAAETTLKYLLSEHSVDRDLQEVLWHYGFTDRRLMRGLGESRDEIKETMKNEFGLDASTSLANRRAIAALLNAWESAVIQVKKEDEMRAEARLGAPLGAERSYGSRLHEDRF